MKIEDACTFDLEHKKPIYYSGGFYSSDYFIEEKKECEFVEEECEECEECAEITREDVSDEQDDGEYMDKKYGCCNSYDPDLDDEYDAHWKSVTELFANKEKQ